MYQYTEKHIKIIFKKLERNLWIHLGSYMPNRKLITTTNICFKSFKFHLIVKNGYVWNIPFKFQFSS